MGKWKLITAGLVVLSIILCMMTIYMQREYNNMRISYNRADRDYTMLKNDYEKLYAAYYSYDKKIIKILEGCKNVFWAEDSSAYVMVTDSNLFFSFYKKPRMEEKDYFLWVAENLENPDYVFIARVNFLKPHDFISYDYLGKKGVFIVAKGISYATPGKRKPGGESISTIVVTK